ncbi:Type II secretion system protein E [Syntrophomonas zehnderi OL-4]|uniref:Type II secretion system protein E n=1 Tax=Syntrophomonas zehnderi OL-4 TaxID=690567 RepID=A0A0E4C7V7_9FIRM|nr:ATPase, T2SS/T4P/T4SS family [Syntrophomonas zehnderi]CFX15353.1 Type II secretion system protein E [Syntrophomonas zehnderi OL-4]
MTSSSFDYRRKEFVEAIRQDMIRKHGNVFLKLNNSPDAAAYEEAACLIRGELEKGCDRETQDYVIAQLIGLGEIDILLKDPTISEIMINKPDDIRIDRNGQIIKTDLAYDSDQDLVNLSYRITQRCGRKINYSTPLVTARLPDGSRVTITFPPSSVHPTITIRRFPKHVFPTEELLASNFLSEEMVPFFKTAVIGKLNIIVCGGTRTGKTSFIRWLGDFIPHTERIITLEETRELGLTHPHCISLEHSAKASIYDLMLAVLHMRPDRIILGEMLGAESLEFLNAAGTGHEGAISSVHTNYHYKQAAINRMVRAMAHAKVVAPEELRSMIAETIDLLVFIKRYPDGSHNIINVCQVESQNGEPVFQDIFMFRKKEGIHQQVGSLSPDLIARIEDNILEDIPNIPSLRGRYHG